MERVKGEIHNASLVRGFSEFDKGRAALESVARVFYRLGSKVIRLGVK